MFVEVWQEEGEGVAQAGEVGGGSGGGDGGGGGGGGGGAAAAGRGALMAARRQLPGRCDVQGVVHEERAGMRGTFARGYRVGRT